MRKQVIFLLALCLNCLLCSNTCLAQKKKKTSTGEYCCTPCGYACDSVVHKGPGICAACKMPLVLKTTIKHRNISPVAVCTLADSGAVLLDVRTPEEFSGKAREKFGRLNNAINIPVQELQTRIKELEPYKHSTILVYCSHSHRSPAASYLLTRAGFTKVVNMLGGMSTWKEQIKNEACNSQWYVQQ